MDLGIRDRVALVTGGGQGIGRQICLILAREGARVAINDIVEERAGGVATEIAAAGGQAMAVVADVTDEKAVEAMVQRVVQEWGRVDILVNNAGFHRDNLTLRMSLKDWDAVQAINLRAPFLCTKAALRQMTRQRGGRIINIGSLSGLAGNAGQANYSAAKAGIVGFTKAVAREMGSRGITANVVAPGLVETDLIRDLPQEVREEAIRRTALGRLAQPKDVAAAVAFLASEEAAYITGQVLVVDGGLGVGF